MTQDLHTPVKSDRFSTRGRAEKNLPPDFEVVEDDRGFYGIRKFFYEPPPREPTMDIICPFCGACHFETTDQYDPDRHAHPGMLRLKEPYLGYGWEPPPPDPSAGSGSLECRDCGALLAPEGKFKVSE